MQQCAQIGGQVRPHRADAEVVAHVRRRQLSNAGKRRILAAADRCTKPGEIGALMRRAGVYSSSLSTWWHQRDAADLPPWRHKSAAPRSTRIAPTRCTTPSSRVDETTCRAA